MTWMEAPDRAGNWWAKPPRWNGADMPPLIVLVMDRVDEDRKPILVVRVGRGEFETEQQASEMGGWLFIQIEWPEPPERIES